MADALDNAGRANAELRELAHGILPSALTRGGLRAAVDALVSWIDLPVHVDVASDRYPPGIEASACFVLAEALTNVIKHARAKRADVKASATDGVLHLQVRDDGVGSASPGWTRADPRGGPGHGARRTPAHRQPAGPRHGRRPGAAAPRLGRAAVQAR